MGHGERGTLIMSRVGWVPFTVPCSLFLVVLLQADAVPRYTPSQFSCSAFQEVVSGDVRGEAGRTVRQERLGRSGILVVRRAAADADSLEAWFDSLLVWREGPEGRTEPDTDGLLGGRW